MHRQLILRQNNERHIGCVLLRHRQDIIVGATIDIEWINWFAKFCFGAALFICVDWSRKVSLWLSRWRWPKWTGHENRFLVFHASSKYEEENFTWTRIWLQWQHWWSNQIFHYTCCNTPKRVTSWRGPFLRHCARATQLVSKKILAVASRKRRWVRFDRPKIWTFDLPLQKRKRVTARPTGRLWLY